VRTGILQPTREPVMEVRRVAHKASEMKFVATPEKGKVSALLIRLPARAFSWSLARGQH